MKKLLAILVLVVTTVCVSADVATVDNYIIGELIDQINASLGELNAVLDADDKVPATNVSGLVQIDTNDTTTVTGYAPGFVGQVLIGGAGTGTNAAWVASGSTTNDWSQILP